MRALPHLASLAMVLATACGHAEPRAETTVARPDAARGSIDEYVDRGMALKARGRCDAALQQGFLPAIAEFERMFGDEPVVAQREDPILLLTQSMGQRGMVAIVTRQGPDGRASRVIGDYYPDVLYLAGYCFVELGDFEHGRAMLDRALRIIPDDALYLSELGHIAQIHRDFLGAIELFHRATDSARALEARAPDADPIGIPIRDIRHRAMRGEGYSLIEIGRLDDAAALYHAILAENPNDDRARQELGYIEQQRRAPNAL